MEGGDEESSQDMIGSSQDMIGSSEDPKTRKLDNVLMRQLTMKGKTGKVDPNLSIVNNKVVDKRRMPPPTAALKQKRCGKIDQILVGKKQGDYTVRLAGDPPPSTSGPSKMEQSILTLLTALSKGQREVRAELLAQRAQQQSIVINSQAAKEYALKARDSPS